MKKETKEQLQKKLNAIEEQEYKEMIAKHYPEFKKLEGKYFKSKSCYSCPKKPSDYWFVYTKVVSVRPKDIYEISNGVSAHLTCITFQSESRDLLIIDTNHKTYAHSLGKEITEKEFMAAWGKLRNKIDSLI
jgi:hypothetical protein